MFGFKSKKRTEVGTYIPTNTNQYRDKSFTIGNSTYAIDTEGRLHGIPGLENAKVVALSATELAGTLYMQCAEALRNQDNAEFLNGVISGQAPQRGLCLMIAVNSQDVPMGQKTGTVTSRITSIGNTQPGTTR